jgi:pilus assembly protein CpaC
MRLLAKARGTGTFQIWFVLCVVLIGAPLAARAGVADSGGVTVRPDAISFLQGESTIVRAPWPVVRVNVTDPTIANVEVLTADQVLLQGLKVGSTDLIVWNEDETQVQRWKVQVKLDTATLKQKLDELFPDAELQVGQSGDSLVLTGLLRSADQVERLHALLDTGNVKYVDMTSVAGVQQVKLEIRVAEVARVALRAMGFNAFHTEEDYFAGLRTGGSGGPLVDSINIGVPGGTPAGSNIGFEFTQDTQATSAVSLFAGFPNANLEFFLQALIENQVMRLLANPTLVALSGEEASFLAGGEFPIPVVQGQGGGGGGAGGTSISIEYKEYGVRVTFRPTVLGDGTIRLTAAPEVSSLSDVGAVTIAGFSVPALVTRKAQTTLELKNGQTFAMAGLLQHENQATNSRVPGLGDLPILGPLFRSVRYQKKETELVILVTVSLVEPMSLASTPPLPGFAHAEPNDWELFIEGRIEGKEPAKINADHARYLQEMGLDRLVGPGAWDSYGAPQSSSQGEFSSNEETKPGSKTPTPQRENDQDNEAGDIQEQ